jgi:hypothetical protein
METITYVTAYYDIGRESWKEFSRSNESYLKNFNHLLNIVKKTNNNLIVFLDVKFLYLTFPKTENVKFVYVDKSFMNSLPLWQRQKKEFLILNSNEYKEKLKNRLKFPENSNSFYTIMMHSKIDFVIRAMSIMNSKYYCWMDFGYFCNDDIQNLLCIEDMNEKINFSIVNKITDQDRDILYTVLFAPEKIAGGVFYGSKDTLLKYQRLYHCIHERFQNMGIVDDDQHITLQCYFQNKDMFELHEKGWYGIFT